MRTRIYSLLLLTAPVTCVAEPPRARPPEFTAEDRAAFFDDAFAALVGERPEPAKATAGPKPSAAPSAEAIAWDELIAPDVLETEIKRQAAALAKASRSASSFKAGAFRDAVDSLGVVATMFAVTAEHAGDPRWNDVAAGLRDRFAAAAVDADDATDAGHDAAALAAGDLEDLVRGGRPTAPDPADAIDWSEIGGRSTLMRRMGAAEEERLRGWVAGDRAFRRNSEDIRHEAQVLAALAEAILRPEAYDFDDPDYQAHARTLRDASVRLSEAAEAEDQPAAAEAMTEVSRSCVDCHADYRG